MTCRGAVQQSVKWAAIVALAVTLLAAREGACWSTKDWYPHIGRGPSYAESAFVSVDMGTEGMEGKVMALGDVDGDSYTDVFVVSKGGGDRAYDTVKVYGWDYWLYQFVAFPSIAVKEPEIRNLIPCDFNGDGRMDLLIQGGSGAAFASLRDITDERRTNSTHEVTENARDLEGESVTAASGILPYLRLYFGDYESFADPVTLPLSADLSVYDVLASAADLNGDTAVDLYLQRKYWLNSGTGETWRVVEQWEGEEDYFPPIADRHSNAFADITGDCFPDLVLFTADDEEQRKSFGRVEDSKGIADEVSDSAPVENENDSTVDGNNGEYESSGQYETTEINVSAEQMDSSDVDDSTEHHRESADSEDVEGESDTVESSVEEESNEEDDSSEEEESSEEESPSPSPNADTEADSSIAKALEVWSFKHHQFQLQRTFALPQGTGRATFADVDSDGALDILFTECTPFPSCSHHNQVHIAYNVQPKICDGVSGVTGKDCLATSALCSATEWDLPDLTSSKSARDIVVVSSDTFDDWVFVWEEESVGALSAPRMGDFNLDGYPDMLLVVLNKETGDRELQLLQNVECDKDLCGSDATDAGRRTFSRLTDGVDALAAVTNVIDATFFDVDEDGDLDLLYNARDDDDNVGRERVGLLYNSLNIDSMFLKAMGSNGVCPQWCPSGDKFPEPKPVGVNYPGATFKYTMTDGAGKRIVATASQLSQTAGGLQLPYCLFGLGRTSSYVDYLFFGIATDTDSDCYFSWQGVIPNAQVAVFPYPYNTPASWFMLMYIHPSGIFFWVVVACVLCCAVLGVIYLALHRREQLQDKKEVEEQAHLFL